MQNWLYIVSTVILLNLWIGNLNGTLVKKEFALVFNTSFIINHNLGYAPSETLLTLVNSKGFVQFNQTNEGGSEVTWVSILTSTPTNITWTEVGNITFSNGNAILFSTLGVGHVKAGPGPDESYGGITYTISGGTGEYADADGFMVDTFIGPANVPYFTINAWGFFWYNST